MEGTDEYDEFDQFDEDAHKQEIDIDQYHERERSKHLLELKLKNYSQRIRDIFKANGDHEGSDPDSENDDKQDTDMQVKINRLGKIMKDIKHLIGMEFTTWNDYITGAKSDLSDRIKKLMWTEVHQAVCLHAHERKGRTFGNSILKTTGTYETVKGEPLPDSAIKIEEIKKSLEPSVPKAMSPKPDAKPTPSEDDKSDNGSKTEHQDDQTEKQDGDQTEKSRVESPTNNNRPRSGKSDDSDDSDTTKKTKTLFNESQAQPDIKDKSSFKPKIIEIDPNKSIMFEDEAYQIEQKQHYIDVGTFLTLIRRFLDDNEDVILIDNIREFDEKLEEAFKAATDIHYDPFKEKLKKTLEQYENALVKGEFRDDKEREVTERIVMDLKDQIFKIEQARGETSQTDRNNKKPKVSIEELRKRGLKDLFEFYSKQHLPEGRKFGDILDKLTVIDLGEFSIF